MLENRVVPSAWLVTNTSNSAATSGSLPWAVAQADIDTSNATITFSPTAFPSATTINLASTLTLSNTAHSITVDGSNLITVNGSNVIYVSPNVNAVLMGLHFAGPSSSIGIIDGGVLAFNNCTVSGFATGVQVATNALLTAADSTFFNNSGPSQGGIVNNGQIVLSGCTLSNDYCAVFNNHIASLDGCTFVGNTGGDGVIYNQNAGTLSIVNCTLVGNSVNESGGAIFIGSGAATICNSTISGNTASQNAGGIYNAGTLTLINSIVAGNLAGGNPSDIGGNVSGSFNLIGTAVSGLTNGVNGNQVGTAAPLNPQLGTLANNGGPTQTIAPLAGSTAIGTGGAITQVNAAVTASANSIPVANAFVFAAANLPTLTTGAYYTIQIGSEQMNVIGVTVNGDGTGTLTVVRAVNSTIAASHPTSTSLYLVSDQRGDLPAFSTPPFVSIGAYQGSSFAPSTLAFSSQPISTVAGSSLGSVTVTDLNGGTPVAGIAVTVAISSGTLTGTTTVMTNLSGVATFSNLSVPMAGTYTLTASTPGATEATSASFTITAGGPAGIVVTTNSDAVSHTGISLRDAVATANADAAAGEAVTVSFAAGLNGQTIALTQGALSLTGVGGVITINGANQVAVSGNHNYRNFSVAANVNAAFSGLTIEFGNVTGSDGGGINSAGNVTLVGCTISNNQSSSSDYGAAGIYNSGSMTISNCTISGNATSNGTGGVTNVGTMTISNSTIANSQSDGLGNTGTLWVYNCAITGNISPANQSGGGVANGGTALLVNTTISGNAANNNSGIENAGAVTVIGCTISGNNAYTAGGGGVHNSSGGTMTIVDSTIANNTAPGSHGAGILNDGAMTVSSTTVAANNAPSASGIYNDGSLTMNNTIVAANLGGQDMQGVASGSNNLVGNGGVSGIANGSNGNQVGTPASPINPLLNVLGNNGGPTQTMSEQAGSPALNTGSALTTLSNAIADTTTTTIALANLARLSATILPTLPSGSYYTIQIEGEQMAVIGASATALTVVRGVNGTTAASHPSGTSVFLVSDQRGDLPTFSTPPFVSIGAYQGSSFAPSTLAFSSQPISTVAGSSLGSVTVTDLNGGTPVAGVAVTVAISSGTLIGTTTATTNSLGVATFSNLSVPMAGTYTLTASTPGATEATSASFTITAGGPVGIVVTTNSDAVSHTGISLRDAVATANADAAAGEAATITFAAGLNGQTIALTQGSLALTGGGGVITINGANQVAISGSNVIQVSSNVNAVLTGMQIAGPSASIGIIDGGVLTFNYCTVSGFATGVQVATNALMTAADSTFSNNSGPSQGGIVNNGQIVLTSCTLSNDYCAVFNNHIASLDGCTFVDDTGGDGVIFNRNAGTLSIVNCTLVGNSVNQSGGAIFIQSGSATICNSTITGNTASQNAGGIYNAGTLTLINSIVAGNLAGGNPSDISGNVSGSFNLVGAGASGLTNGVNGNQVGTAATPLNPQLGTLANNGGPTQTIAPLAGSSAIGAGGAITQVNSAVTASTISIPVANGFVFAAANLPTLTTGAYYTIQIESEQMAVIGANATALTVVRGINGTTVASHPSGASVFLVADQRGFLVPSNSPPIENIGAYQTAAVNKRPTITSVSPNAGNLGGGTTVTITGTNFTGTNAVLFGSALATNFTVFSDTQIIAVDPAGQAGTLNITVAGPLGTSAQSISDQFSYVLTAVTLSTANLPDNAATLTINGTGFDPIAANDTVTFGNGVIGTVTAATSTQLTVSLSTPPTALGSLTAIVNTDGASSGTAVQVATVVNGNWIVTDPSSAAGSLTDVTLPYAVAHALNGDQITFAAGLSGDTISLSSPLTINSSVTITGPATGTVTLAGPLTVASGATVIEQGDLTLGASGTLNVVGTLDIYGFVEISAGGTVNDQGTLNVELGGTLSDQDSITVTAGSVLNEYGNLIEGAGGSLTVQSGGVLNVYGSVTIDAGGTLDIAPGGTVIIYGSVTIDAGAIYSLLGTVTIEPGGHLYLVPTVTSISPATGSAAGGTVVTITGTGFTGATAVMFGSTAATTFTINSDTQITATSPADTGVVDITVVAPAGTSATSNADQFTYVAATTTTSLTDNGPNPSSYGQAVSFTATVTGGPAITGETVTIEDADNADAVVASPTLVGGAVTFTISDLTVGTHDLFAVYGGDATNASSNDSARPVTQIVTLLAPAVASVVVNGGTPQYTDGNGTQVSLAGQNSVVEQILVTFNEPVTLDPGAFTITNDASAVTVLGGIATPNMSPVGLNAPIPVAGSGGTQYILTFLAGSGVNSIPAGPLGLGAGTCIMDGVYTLNTIGSKVHANGQTAADNNTGFWALFGSVAADNVLSSNIGDGNSDIFVDTPDAAQFKIAFGMENDSSLLPSQPYDVAMDSNLSGVICTEDAAKFKHNFGAEWMF